MMNRCAELLFWVGRYIERTENHTRLIDVNYHLRHELKGKENEQFICGNDLLQRLVTLLRLANIMEQLMKKQLLNS